jgi:prepilin-type processing-associated H-X9-DG protein
VEIDTWMHGPTWWVYTMPYVEQNNSYDKIVFPRQTFWFGGAGGHPNTLIWKNARFSYMECPSGVGARPRFSDAASGDVGYQRPFYTCILGAVPHPTAMTQNPSQFNGPVSDGGVITLARGQRMSAVTDGTSNTIMIGEQSGKMYHNNGSPLPIPGDSNNYDGRVDNNRGFHMGTSHVGYPEGDNTMDGPPTNPPGPIPKNCTHPNCARCYNTTTINTRGIVKRGLVFADYGESRCNRPLNSEHPNGANMLFADGHVDFVTATIPLANLKAFANRDDGEVISP